MLIHTKSLSLGKEKGIALGHVAWGLGAGLTPVSGLPDLLHHWHSQPAGLSILPLLNAESTVTETFYLLICGEGSVYRTPFQNNIFALSAAKYTEFVLAIFEALATAQCILI